MAAAALNYPSLKGIPINRIDMHSLRNGGANALALSGYSDMQIQKWVGGREQCLRNKLGKNLHVFPQ